MDLKFYYQNIRDEEAKISDPFPVVVSTDTEDGGKPGMQTEVTRALAAKMIVDGRARLATTDETNAFRKTKAEAKAKADQAAEAAKLQFTVVPVSKKG